jgi:two-component system sensor histidine kinase EvgS
MRALVVEDDPLVRVLVCDTLREAGYDVLEAEGVDEALAIWAVEPNLRVLTDIGLPGRSGVELIAAIRRAEPAAGRARTRIVAMTAEQRHRHACLEAGADRFLLKPVPPAELLAALLH